MSHMTSSACQVWTKLLKLTHEIMIDFIETSFELNRLIYFKGQNLILKIHLTDLEIFYTLYSKSRYHICSLS